MFVATNRRHCTQCVHIWNPARPASLAVGAMPPSQPHATRGGSGPPHAVGELMTLDLLPAELWRAVAAYLSADDRTAFRAVSKARSS